jgi:predicted PurR-regulated permease PerM
MPIALAVMTIVEHADEVAERVTSIARAGVPEPPDWVARIPLVGDRIDREWRAVTKFSPEESQSRIAPYVKDTARWALVKAGGLAAFLVHLLLTLVISALLYAKGESAVAGVRAFARRLAGERGDKSITLAGQAIRAVALGVVVTALVQAALGGIGLWVAGVPFAGVLTALMFVLAVAQIGAGPVLIGALIWLYWYGEASTTTVIIFLVWSIFVGAIDNVLRPLLIRSGADLPLILIFAGVVGGLLAFGIVGLFVGPVILAIVYTELSSWVTESNSPT